VHWPTDVLAGAAIGVGAAYATLHWWPLGPDAPAQTAHAAEVAAIEDGDGLLVLVNPNAGIAGEDATDVVKHRWPRATVVHPKPGADLIEQLADEVSSGPGDIRAIGVAGGDGTVAAVAAVAAEFRLPLVVVPAGTLNHFARDIGVDGIDAAVARAHRWFVNTASLGGYPEMVRLRERLEKRGWPKWPAAAVSLHRSLRRAQPIRMSVNGRSHLVWWLFVGNGTYSPKGFVPTHRPVLDSGMLDVRYLRADVPYSRLRFVLATLTRTLHTSHVYRQRDLAELDVRLLDDVERRIATDGEVGPLGSRFRFRSRPSALAIYRPTESG
jgi:diacylglycerol kinase family enzyme